jgi:hypothetical protein
MAFTTITVTGTFLAAGGSAASGNITFVASATMTDSASNQTVSPTLVTGTLNGSGVLSVALTATDDSTTQPTGVTYEVTENVTGAGQNKYNIEVPASSPGGTLDLADITPAVTPITSYSYATQAYVNTLTSGWTPEGYSASELAFAATSELASTDVQAAIEEVRSKSKYTHTQQTPATTWSITHNLAFRPNVAVVDTSDTLCYGDIDYTSDNALTVTFAQSFGGKAYLS